MKDNLLAKILAHVNKDADTSCDKLIKKFGSFVGVAEADMLAVSDALDGDMTTSLYIKLVSALVSRRRCDVFRLGKKHTEEEIREYLVSLLFGLSVETVYLLAVKEGRVIACERAGEGTVNTSNVLPRRLIEIAKRHRADSVIIAHNHPGGYAIPSDEDKSGTRILYEFFAASGVVLLTHYIVAGLECQKIDFN